MLLTKKYSFWVRVLVCVVLAATLMLAVPHLASAATATAPAGISPSRCDISWTNLSSIFDYACWGRLIGSILASFVVSIASWILTISGLLFNWVLNITVVQFGQFMTSTVIQAITSAWTAFRDVANIVIIGMFTFIAVSIILGLKEFGQKRLIAHVLIIAVLINFSLLFTKMTIDASNFVATQFYNAGLNQLAGGSAVTSTNVSFSASCPQGTPSSQCYGVAGAFMDYAGVSGFADTGQAVRNLADSTDSGVLAVLFAFFTASLFLGAALVLFYGSFLLISRGILFIFLMAVSALAFASYLVPVWDKSNYGFGAWKSSLLKNALLAPLMVMFLWMTLNIAAAMKASAGGGTLGDLISNPTKALDINALFGYVVVLGLLFVSFKMSASLAGKIGGFNFASMAPALGIAAGSRVAGLLGKYSVGLGAGAGSRAIGRTAASLNAAGYTRTAKGLLGAATPLDKLAKRDFNLMNTAIGKNISGVAGLKGAWSGATPKGGGIEGTQKALAEKYAKDAEKLKLNDDQKGKILESAVQSTEQRQQFKENRSLLKGLKQTAEQNLATNERAAAQNKPALEQAHNEAQKNLEAVTKAVKDNQKDAQENFGKEMKGLTDQMAKATTPEETTVISNKMRGLEKQRDAQLRSEENRIEQARATVSAAKNKIDLEDGRVRSSKDQLAKIKEEDENLTARVKAEADAAVKREYPNMNKTTEQIASSVANKRATNLFGAFTKEENDHLAGLARKKSKETAEDKRLKRVFDSVSKSESAPAADKPAGDAKK